MSIIGVITARGGSKGILRKSIAPCAGRPLLAYTCAAALQSKLLDRVVLSTDDDIIAQTGRDCGVDVPFMRPPELATDTASQVDVLRHAADFFAARGEEVEAVVLLQPTSPLRSAADIDGAISLFRREQADSVVSLMETPHQFSPVSVMKMADDGRVELYLPGPLITRRQEKPVTYGRNGPAVVVTRPSWLRDGKLYGDRNYGYVMSMENSIDIDGPEDLALAEIMLERRHKDGGP